MSESYDSSPFLRNARINEEKKCDSFHRYRATAKRRLWRQTFRRVSSLKSIHPFWTNYCHLSQVQMETDPTIKTVKAIIVILISIWLKKSLKGKYLRNEKVYGQGLNRSLVVWGLFPCTFGNRAVVAMRMLVRINGTVGDGLRVCWLLIGIGIDGVLARLLAEQTELVVWTRW